MQNKSFHSAFIRFTFSLIAATTMATVTLPAAAKEVKEEKKQEDQLLTYKMLNLFGDVFERVRRDYVVEVSDEDLIKSAINGMLTSLDPHSSYMDEKDFAEMQVQTKGEFGGLGIEVTMENGLVKVVSPIDETPAAKAGILSGDFISHIDDEPIMGLTLPEAVEKMRGKVGTQIKITVLREGEAEPLNFTLTRDRIKIDAVAARVEGDIAYLRIRSFSETAHSDMLKHFEKIQKEMGGKIKGIVLDLRNNPGGLLDQAVAVSDDFIDQGEIVSTRGREASNTTRYNAKEGKMIPTEIPMVILVNAGSASASEIVAGALQDHKRAILVGTKTFGKGSVQTVIPLNNYGAMRLTTARYYTPSGRSIQAEGIVPDIMVEQAKVEPIKNPSMRMEADLRGRLDKGETATNATPKEEEETTPKEVLPGDSKAPTDGAKDKTKDKGKDAKKGKDGEEATAEDYQLSRALDLLRGLSIYGESQAPVPAKK